MRSRLPSFAASIMLLSGCAGVEDAYPSLAARPIENISLAEPVARPVEVTPDPALETRIAGIERSRRTASGAFDTAAARVEREVRAARSARVGSQQWIDAQTALAQLDERRAAHQDVLGELEDLSAGRIEALQPAYPALESALEAGRAAASAQTRRIDAISALVPTA